MDFEKQSVKNYFLYDTEIENLFIGEYMLDAPGDYVKVYLLAMMHAGVGEPIDNSMIAKELTLSEATVDKAWDYWQSVGIVKKVAKSESTDAYKVMFINVKEAVFGKCAIEVAGTGKTSKAPIDLSSADLGQLYRGIEKVTGRLLEGKEAEIVAGWITEFGISPDVILYCYKYSTENGKSNRVKYVEKILMDWREKNLETVGMIEEYLGESDRAFKLYKRVFKALGFDGRKPTEPEKLVMRKWFFDMNLSIDDVLAAIDKTTASSSPSIKYVDAIITQNHKVDETSSNDSAYSRVEAVYERIRQENALKSKQIRDKIYKDVPDIEEIMTKLKDCSAKAISAMLSRDVKLQQQIESERKQLTKDKEKLLKDYGYAANALDPIFTCSKCKDTGVLDDGSTCSCYAEKLEVFINGRKGSF